MCFFFPLGEINHFARPNWADFDISVTKFTKSVMLEAGALGGGQRGQPHATALIVLVRFFSTYQSECAIEEV